MSSSAVQIVEAIGKDLFLHFLENINF